MGTHRVGVGTYSTHADRSPHVVASGGSAHTLRGGERTDNRVFPEVDVYSGLTSNTQFWFQSKETREDSAPDQAETDFEAFQAAIRSGRLSTEPAKGAGLEFLM